MAQVKLLFLIANLIFVRMALAVSAETSETENLVDPSTNLNQQQQQQDSSILNNISSLDFAPNEQTARTQPNQELHPDEKVLSFSSDQQDQYLNYSNNKLENTTQSNKSNRAGKSSGRKRYASTPTFAQLLINLLSQLEKVDVKRLITDSMSQVKSSTRANSNLPDLRQPSRRSSNNLTSESSTPKTKERINGSALSAETGNFLSITKQLVKLARGQMMGGAGLGGSSGEFGSLNSWLNPMMMPSMLSAAGHMFQHDSNDFAAASKSDLFWMVVPAVIVIGAGVIVIPLIAAWLVSHMMNQNTFTVSAGRRRRRRDVSGQNLFSPNSDLLQMLDIHQLMDDAPQLLVDKLTRLHAALDSVGSSLADQSTKPMKSRKTSSFN